MTTHIPKTPSERAANLRSAGGEVVALPSYKRGAYMITCSKCKGTMFGSGEFVVGDVRHHLPQYLGDVPQSMGRSGRRTWLIARAHLLTCQGHADCSDSNMLHSPLAKERDARQQAVLAPHYLLRAWQDCPIELRDLFFAELDVVLETIKESRR